MKTIKVGLIGTGQVGKAFLSQLAQQQSYLKEHFKLEVKLVSVARSKNFLYSEDGIDVRYNFGKMQESQNPVRDLIAKFKSSQQNQDNQEQGKVKQGLGTRHVAVDCSASEEVSNLYPQFLGNGVSVVAANKQVGSGHLDRYMDVCSKVKAQGPFFGYEATVGAGLPVISTLKELISSGDEIQSIEGVLSGTLSYIFNNMNKGLKFSDSVKQAKENGYTEPDPREDLYGTDIARKLIILAREVGLQVSIEDVKVESLIPPQFDSISVQEFLRNIDQLDSKWKQLSSDAQKNNQKLSYVGGVDFAKKELYVKVKQYPEDSLFAHLKGADNIISFKTKRYSQNTLNIIGPGAGADVTAAGVFGDLIKLSLR